MTKTDDCLPRAMGAIRDRLERLKESRAPVECVAEGKLQVALGAIESAAELLGEGFGEELWRL